jgi:hypothetical protein
MPSGARIPASSRRSESALILCAIPRRIRNYFTLSRSASPRGHRRLDADAEEWHNKFQDVLPYLDYVHTTPAIAGPFDAVLQHVAGTIQFALKRNDLLKVTVYRDGEICAVARLVESNKNGTAPPTRIIATRSTRVVSPRRQRCATAAAR